MTKNTCDANNRGSHIRPRNSSQSFKNGGGAMRNVLDQHYDQAPHDISGGAKTGRRTQPVEREPGETDSLDAQRTSQERSQDIKSQRASGYLPNVRRGSL